MVSIIFRIQFIILMIVMIAGIGSAQKTITLSVDKAIDLGLENNKTLHASLMKVEAADARSGEMNASRLPLLKFGGSYTKLSKVDSFSIGPFPPILPTKQTISPSIFDNYNLKLTLQQPIFTGNRISSNYDIASYTAQAAEQDYTKDRADLIYNIQNGYWGLFKAKEFKKVIDETVEQMKAHVKNIQNMYAQGIVTKNEVLKIEVQLSNAQMMQIESQNNVRLATIALNNLIGLPLDTEIDLASGIETQTKTYEDLHGLVQRAIEYRPEIRGMDYRVKAGESAVTLSRSGWMPQIFLIGNYYYARPNQRIFPSKDEFKDTWDLSLSVSLDIWNWGTTIHQTTQAQAQLSQAQDALSQLRDGITLEVTQNFLTVNQWKERIAVAEKGVGQAEENYRITNEKFKSGLALNSDLLDAEVALLQARWNRIQALVDYALAEVRLHKAIGDISYSKK